jgi:hypothetical protein
MGERITARDMTMKGGMAAHCVWTQGFRVHVNGRQEALKAPSYVSAGAWHMLLVMQYTQFQFCYSCCGAWEFPMLPWL